MKFNFYVKLLYFHFDPQVKKSQSPHANQHPTSIGFLHRFRAAGVLFSHTLLFSHSNLLQKRTLSGEKTTSSLRYKKPLKSLFVEIYLQKSTLF